MQTKTNSLHLLLSIKNGVFNDVDAPSCFYCELNEKSQDKIMELGTYIRQNELRKISKDDKNGVWAAYRPEYSKGFSEKGFQGLIEKSGLSLLKNDIESRISRTKESTICINDEHFWFECEFDDFGQKMTIKTELLPIPMLYEAIGDLKNHTELFNINVFESNKDTWIVV